MLSISIDGACRRNGKPDCVSGAGIFVAKYDKNNNLKGTHSQIRYDFNSTNQRGELLALYDALCYIADANKSAEIITDSEYLFNTMTKEWYISWEGCNWYKSNGEQVKNRDLWKKIIRAYRQCVDKGLDVTFYHIKGHCISFGYATACKLLKQHDGTTQLFTALLEKYNDVSLVNHSDKMIAANLLSEKNNGFFLSPEVLKRFIVMNAAADIIATQAVEKADFLFKEAKLG